MSCLNLGHQSIRNYCWSQDGLRSTKMSWPELWSTCRLPVSKTTTTLISTDLDSQTPNLALSISQCRNPTIVRHILVTDKSRRKAKTTRLSTTVWNDPTPAVFWNPKEKGDIPRPYVIDPISKTCVTISIRIHQWNSKRPSLAMHSKHRPRSCFHAWRTTSGRRKYVVLLPVAMNYGALWTNQLFTTWWNTCWWRYFRLKSHPRTDLEKSWKLLTILWRAGVGSEGAGNCDRVPDLPRKESDDPSTNISSIPIEAVEGGTHACKYPRDTTSHPEKEVTQTMTPNMNPVMTPTDMNVTSSPFESFERYQLLSSESREQFRGKRKYAGKWSHQLEVEDEHSVEVEQRSAELICWARLELAIVTQLGRGADCMTYNIYTHHPIWSTLPQIKVTPQINVTRQI